MPAVRAVQETVKKSRENCIPSRQSNKWVMMPNLVRVTSLVPKAWWRHQMETFFGLLTVCTAYTGNSTVNGAFTTQRPVTRSFNICFDPRLNKRSSKLWWGWWFETPLWRHYNGSIEMQVMCETMINQKYPGHYATALWIYTIQPNPS